MTAATLDEVSRGRILLGLGTGEQSWMEKQGIESKRPMTAVSEYVTIIRRLMTGQLTTFTGEVFRISQTKLRFKPKRQVPIYIAARGPKMLQLAGKIANGVLCAEGLWTPEHVEWIIKNVKMGAEAGGRDARQVEIASYVIVAASNDQDRARKDAKRAVFSLLIRGLLDQQVERIRLYSPEVAKLFEHWRKTNHKSYTSIPDELITKLAIYGTTKECAKKISEFRQSGVSIPVIIPAGSNLKGIFRISTLL